MLLLALLIGRLDVCPEHVTVTAEGFGRIPQTSVLEDQIIRKKHFEVNGYKTSNEWNM